MKTIDNSDLVDQLNQYILDLIHIRDHITKKDSSALHLQVLKSKIDMKITHFKSAVQQLGQRQYANSSLS